MKMNKNLSSSLLLSLLCLSSCLFAPISSAAELNVADLQEEIASTKLVRSLKPQGSFFRASTGATSTDLLVLEQVATISGTSPTSKLTSDSGVAPAAKRLDTFGATVNDTIFKSGNSFSNVGGLRLAYGQYFAEPLQNLHVGFGGELAILKPTFVTDRSKNTLHAFGTGLYAINNSWGIQVELGIGAAMLSSSSPWIASVTPVVNGSFKLSYRLLNKWMFAGGLVLERTLGPALNAEKPINEASAGLHATAAYLFDSVTTEEMIVE